jgi:hypothetical protein
MNIKELKYLKEFKKFNKIKYIVASVPYFDNFISLKSLSLRTLD